MQDAVQLLSSNDALGGTLRWCWGWFSAPCSTSGPQHVLPHNKSRWSAWASHARTVCGYLSPSVLRRYWPTVRTTGPPRVGPSLRLAAWPCPAHPAPSTLPSTIGSARDIPTPLAVFAILHARVICSWHALHSRVTTTVACVAHHADTAERAAQPATEHIAASTALALTLRLSAIVLTQDVSLSSLSCYYMWSQAPVSCCPCVPVAFCALMDDPPRRRASASRSTASRQQRRMQGERSFLRIVSAAPLLLTLTDAVHEVAADATTLTQQPCSPQSH